MAFDQSNIIKPTSTTAYIEINNGFHFCEGFVFSLFSAVCTDMVAWLQSAKCAKGRHICSGMGEEGGIYCFDFPFPSWVAHISKKSPNPQERRSVCARDCSGKENRKSTGRCTDHYMHPGLFISNYCVGLSSRQL